MRKVIALLLVAASLTAQAAPGRITAHYSLTRNGQELAEVVEVFTQDRGRYRIESVTQAVGVLRLLTRENIRFLSEGRVTRNGLQPLHFEHHRGAAPARRIIADFDWKARQARLQHDGEEEILPISPGLQDRLSLMYQFMFLKLDKPVLVFDMTNGRKISRYTYRRVEEGELVTPAGSFRTVQWSRVREPGDEGTDVWLALDRHQLPVKIVFEEEGGARLTQVLTRLLVQ